jgi:hypothetical protein
MNLEDVLLRDTRANQPVASAVAAGSLYYVTDENITEQSDGSSWLDYSDSGAVSAITQLTGDVTAGPGSGSVAATIANNAVSNAKLRDSGALSVIGRSANSSGDPADISATPATDAVLRESGSVLGFGTVAAGGIAANAVITAKILDDNVTYAKIQNVSTTDRILGLDSAGPANIEEIPVSSGLEFTGGPGLRVTAAVRTIQVGITVDGAGSPITSGVKGYKSCPVAGTITGWRLMADATGDVEFDVLLDDFASFPPTASIVGAAPPELAGVQMDEDTVGSWSTGVAAGDVFGFEVQASPTPTVERVTLELTIVVT